MYNPCPELFHVQDTLQDTLPPAVLLLLDKEVHKYLNMLFSTNVKPISIPNEGNGFI